MNALIPGTETTAPGLGWELVYTQIRCGQVGEVWRKSGTAFAWPGPSGEDLSAVTERAKAHSRWAVRATIDAVVAQAYGLPQDQYGGHPLASISNPLG